MKKIAVVDIDDTLMTSGKLSYFLWCLSGLFKRFARRLQPVNMPMVSQLGLYEEVVILTGKDAGESLFTERQLRVAGVVFDSLVRYPRNRLIEQWKSSVVSKMFEEGQVDWIDDMFDASDRSKSKLGNAEHLVPKGVRPIAPQAYPLGNRYHIAVLEWL